MLTNRYPELTDTISEQGLKLCTSLKKLSLKNCESLTSTALLSYFIDVQPRLEKLNLSRNVHLTDEAIVGVLNTCCSTLQYLNLNGLDELTSHAFTSFSNCVHLRKLDISWIRCVDDEFFTSMIEKCKWLESVSVYGCHRLTECVLDKTYTNEDGRRIRIIGNEFD
jgi:DNA repair protein RAD7